MPPSPSANSPTLPSWILTPFTRGIRSSTEFSSGVELEYFVVDAITHGMVRYEGPRGIGALLQKLVDENGWSPQREGDYLIGLNRGKVSITLEPGGVLEVVTQPHKSLHGLLEEMQELTGELATAAHRLDRALLCAGYHPLETKEAVGLVPKSRYQFMYPTMGHSGSLGQEMMKLTASVQVTLDFSSESDAMRKYALACRLVPIFIALSANSPFRQGSRHDYHSFRSYIWTQTDGQRAGLPPFALQGSSTFMDYATWALDIPVYFLQREGRLIPQENTTFRQLLASHPDISLTDWELHLSTMFPWIRLRNYLEIRAFDMVPPVTQKALVALVHGLFYHPDGLAPAEKIVEHLDRQSILRLIEEAACRGTKTRDVADSPLGSLCHHVLEVAHKGLPKRNQHLLDPLRERLDHELNESSSLDAFMKACIL